MIAEGRTHTQRSVHTHKDKTKGLCVHLGLGGGGFRAGIAALQGEAQRGIPLLKQAHNPASLLRNSQNLRSKNLGCWGPGCPTPSPCPPNLKCRRHLSRHSDSLSTDLPRPLQPPDCYIPRHQVEGPGPDPPRLRVESAPTSPSAAEALCP